MKNIHVLPTENESRIRYNSFNKVYELCEFPKYHTDIKSTHNIYITSNEEIKEGDWYLNIEEENGIKNPFYGKLYKANQSIKSVSTEYKHNLKKIILTTDQDLIKDGVQAIDDEFLEWFVKNPSCEEVVFSTYHVKGDISGKLHYQIIILKEEVKQETLEEAAENHINKFKYTKHIGYDGFIEGAKWQKEQIGKSEFLQKLRATKSDAEARRLIFEQFKNK